MFELATFEDTIRVPPEFLGEKKEESVAKALQQKYENKIIKELGGTVVAITDVKQVSAGKIVVEDPGVHYKATFEAMVFVPKIHEVIEGQVVDITNFGIFVRFGPIDGLCHISQITNEFITFDDKNKVLVGKEGSKITVRVGDLVRARITGVSLEKKEINKVNITMRQPGLGKLEWLENADKEKKAPKAEKKEAPAKKKKEKSKE